MEQKHTALVNKIEDGQAFLTYEDDVYELCLSLKKVFMRDGSQANNLVRVGDLVEYDFDSPGSKAVLSNSEASIETVLDLDEYSVRFKVQNSPNLYDWPIDQIFNPQNRPIKYGTSVKVDRVHKEMRRVSYHQDDCIPANLAPAQYKHIDHIGSDIDSFNRLADVQAESGYTRALEEAKSKRLSENECSSLFENAISSSIIQNPVQTKRKQEVPLLMGNEALSIEELVISSIQKECLEFKCKKPIYKRDSSSEECVLYRYDLNKDGRQSVYDTASWPYSVQGRIIGYLHDDYSLGSGTMIGPQVVLTCAHNVWVRGNNIEIDKESMKFYPALSGPNKPFGVANILEVYYPEEYKTTGKEDYAILVLDRRIGDYTGYFGIKEIPRRSLEDREAYSYGYPGPGEDTKRIRKKEEAPIDSIHFLKGMRGYFHIDPYNDMIHHNIDTENGQSGSAVYIEEDGDYYAIGVHVTSIKQKDTVNIATYLNKARIKRIEGWIRDFATKHRVKINENKHSSKSNLCISYDNIIDMSITPILDLSSKQINLHLVNIFVQLNLETLIILDLSNNNIEDEGAEVLSQANFINLTALDLSENQIGDNGVISICRGNWKNLEVLGLSWNKIGDNIALPISLSRLNQLTRLYLWSNQIDFKTYVNLKETLPKVEIYY